MIALTNRLYACRSIARSLLLLIVVTAAIIVGLLAMHSLNTHTATDAGHPTTISAAADVAADDHHAGNTAADEPCADCGAGGHSDMLTLACVLALLATVLLLARPRGGSRWLSVLPRPKPIVTPAKPRSGTRPPSLTALCISRT